MPGTDNIEFSILEDGTIKITTDKVSMPNHVNAEQFLRAVSQLAGGKTTRVRRVDVHHNLQRVLNDHEKDGHTHN